jgi:VanZ family protein
MSIRKNHNIGLAWILVVLWMGVIFNLSAQPANHSNKLSKGITEKIVETVEKAAPNVDLDLGKLNHIVRKNAHFFIYLVLAVLVARALRKSGVQGLRSFWIAWAICIFYASTDEFHQLFVPGRGAQIRDVLIDSTGALLGIGIFVLARSLVNTNNRKNK